MKKFLACILALIFCFFGCVTNKSTIIEEEHQLELKGVWFSYYDWGNLPQDEEDFKEAVKNVISTVKETGLNAIFLHAHSHSDSYYKKSTYFPLSSYISFTKEFSEDFDPFEFFIEEAHKEGIQIHAWFNPYRVGSAAQFEKIEGDSLLAKWKTSDEEDGSRHILFHKGSYYLNPSLPETVNAITDAIIELCQNYDVDGLHFDDYFYPALDDNSEKLCFDLVDWESSECQKDLEQWRRDNVSLLVQSVYNAVHKEKPSALFGISPMGNIPRLLEKNQYLIDLEKWISEPGFIDYILPQIYWGFEIKKGDGSQAPWAFEPCLASWTELLKESSVTLYVGLPLYKAGKDGNDGNEICEWLRKDDIIARQIQTCKKNGRVSGISIFDWQDFSREEAQTEVRNIKLSLWGNFSVDFSE